MLIKNRLSVEESLSHQMIPQSENCAYSWLTKISYCVGPVLIIVCHFGTALALVTGLSLGAWLWIFLLYGLRMLATTAIYHRLLTHKAYSTPVIVRWIGSLVGASAGQMGPSWWKAHHEAHHQFVDQPGDPHSSRYGFWWAHCRWLLSKNHFPASLPADIEQDVVLRAIDRFHFLPLIALGYLSYLIGGLEYLSAFFISTTLLFHGVALVNSACHKFGNTPFATGDESKNNWVVAMLTLGEGWHNFHHAFPWSARQGITIANGEVEYLTDWTYSFITGLQFLGLASKLRTPSERVVLASPTTSPKMEV